MAKKKNGPEGAPALTIVSHSSSRKVNGHSEHARHRSARCAAYAARHPAPEGASRNSKGQRRHGRRGTSQNWDQITQVTAGILLPGEAKLTHALIKAMQNAKGGNQRSWSSPTGSTVSA